MKKIKKIWNENRVLMVLAIILIICFTTLFVVALTYFYGSNKSEYGNRLDGIDDVKITKKRDSELEGKITGVAGIENVELVNKGKMIYVSLKFVDGTTMDTAKTSALSTLEHFTKEEKEFYDINYTIKTSEYTLMGACNNGENIIWNNNTPIEESGNK